MSEIGVENSPAPQSSFNVGVILSWLTIVGVLAFVFARNWSEAHTPAVEQAADDVSMQMEARAAVGYRAITSGMPKAGTESHGANDNLRTMTRQVASEAHTPRERLRAVTVIGEMQGGPAALDELNRVTPFLSSPALKADAESLRTIYTKGVDALSPEAREDLLDRQGWFGQLALTFKLPGTDAPRKEIVSTGMRAMIAMFTVEFGIFVLLLGGIALLTLAIVRLIDRKLLLAYQTSAHPGSGAFLEAFALYLAGYVGLGWLLHHLNSKRELVNYGAELLWVAFACMWPLLRGATWPQLRQGLGWHTGRGVFREATAGLGGYLAGMPLMALAIYCTTILVKISGERPVHPIVFGGGRGDRLAAIVGLYLLASVWAPIVEETMFRGALFHHLRARHRWLFAAVLSGVIFAALHPQGWAAIPVLAAIGIIFAGIRECRGSFVASATAHAFNNAVAVTLLILVLG
jgi:membrane protease YdiL (CAAX protease family)